MEKEAIARSPLNKLNAIREGKSSARSSRPVFVRQRTVTTTRSEFDDVGAVLVGRVGEHEVGGFRHAPRETNESSFTRVHVAQLGRHELFEFEVLDSSVYVPLRLV